MPYKDKEKQRLAQARYYQENKKQINASQNLKRNKMRRYIQEVKESVPCMDCGIQYPHYIMDFDHRPGTLKLFNIGSELSNMSSFEVLKNEIAKCDIVCSNCHRHRTYIRLVKLS